MYLLQQILITSYIRNFQQQIKFPFLTLKCYSLLQINQLQFTMISFIVLGVSLILLLAIYYLYIQPSKRINNFAKYAQSLGYKVKLMPYQFMRYFLIKYLRQDQKSLKIFKQQLKQYDLIVGNMFTSLAIVPANQELLKDFFNQASKFPKSPLVTETFQLLNGGGVVFSQGQLWKKKRRTISSVFHFEFLNDMIPMIKKQIEKEFQKIDKNIPLSQNINLLKSFMRILSSVIARSFFGIDMTEYKIEGIQYCDYFVEFLNEMMSFNSSLEHFIFGMKVYNLGLSSQSRKLKKKYEILTSIAKEIIQKELEKIKLNQTNQKNMLTALYKGGLLSLDFQNPKPQQYSFDDLIGEFFAFFAAGTDTTAHSVNVALHYLSQHNQFIQKIRDQIQNLKKNKDLSQADRVKNMKWIEAVFNQTLRLNGSIGYIFLRKSIEEAQLGKLQIPKGTSVTMMPVLIHYKDDNFTQPEVFKPQRWIEEKTLLPFSFIPFGAGQRNCLGQHLARIEAKLLLSMILQRYDVKAVKPLKMKIAFVYGSENAEYQIKIRQKTQQQFSITVSA